MSIIYSYPEQGALNANDLLIGTSAEKVGGKQKNITRNFSIQQIADFINRGAGFVDPVASDFQIPVFNQEGKKITGSIMSQDSSPSNGAAGSAITIAGSLVTTGDLTSPGVVTIGGGTNLITLNSETYLKGSLRDSANVLGADKQILLSDQFGYTTWTNYEAGLTYEGTWDANANTTNGLSNSPALLQGAGVSGHFYIVNVEGTTSLGPGLNDWHVGDWAVFLDEGGQPASWQKIDNTSVLTGSGTAGTFAKWTNATTLNDSIMSESGTVVSVDGDLKVKDTIQATTGPSSSLKLKGVGTGGVEIMSADGVTDGKITLNCSQNSHGVTLQSPPHASGATYTLILPTSFGGPGDVLTSAGANPSQLVWTTPTTGTVTGTGTENYVTKWSAGGTGIQNSTIFDDGTNVGIGTSSPASTLHVNSGAANRAATFTSSDPGVSLALIDPNGFAQIQTTSGNLIFDADRDNERSNSYIGFEIDGGSEKMRIDSTGNVGIATTSPTDGNLQIGDVNSAFSIAIAGTRAKFGYDGANAIVQGGASKGIVFYSNAQEAMRISSAGDVGIGTTSPDNKLHLSGSNPSSGDIALGDAYGQFGIYNADNQYGMQQFVTGTGDGHIQVGRIDGSATSYNLILQELGGNVGIGTTSPSYPFHVYNETVDTVARFESGDTSAAISLKASDNTALFTTSGTDFLVKNDGSGNLRFFNNGSERLRIDSSGNVGIGTTSPAVSLDISATDAVQMPVGITGDRPLTGVSNGMLRYNSTNNEFEGYINGNWGSIGGGAAGGLIFRGTFDASTGAIASGGSLYTCPAGGSGGTVDTAIGDLYIVTTAGSFFCSGTSLNVGDEVICITAATATNDNVNNWNAIASGAGGAVTGSGTTNYVPKFTGATVVGNSSIFNDASGNVGIGTTSPRTKLQVSGLTGDDDPALGSSTAPFFVSNLANSYGLNIGINNLGTSWLQSQSNVNVVSFPISLNPLGGNVGIGTTSPSARLHVEETSNVGISSVYATAIIESGDAQLDITSGPGGTWGSSLNFVEGGGSANIDIWSIARTTSTYNSDLRFNFGTNNQHTNSTKVTFTSGGNVGIGTDSPGAKLDVSGEDSVIASFRVTGGVSNNKRLEIGSGGDRTILKSFTDTTDAAAGIAFSNGNSEAMRIDSTGNVGIGTDSPEVSLDLGSNTDAIRVPNGPIADRPSGILPGMIRYNTSTSEFEGYSGVLNVSGSWGALGGSSLPTKTVDTFTGSGQVFIDLTVEASSVNYIDMYIDGVYQAKATYTIATPGGTGISRLTLVSGTFPTGVSIETVTTT